MNYCPVTGRYYSITGGWWPCELTALKSMIKAGYSYKQIAAVLDRQYAGVVVKAKKLKKQGVANA